MNALTTLSTPNSIVLEIEKSDSFENKRNVQNNFAKEMLLDDNYNISEIAYMVGFNDPQYFSKCFRSRYGVSPRKYRELNKKNAQQPARKNHFLEKVNKVIQSNLYFDDYNLELFAADMKMSKSSLYRKIKQLTGMSPCGYIRSQRIEEAKSLLHNTGSKVVDVAVTVGFRDVKYFSRCFREETGKYPSEFMKQRYFENEKIA